MAREQGTSISRETIRQTLKKNERPPHLKQYWAIPSEYSAEFVAPMEEVLAVYQHPYDPAYPVICMDETSKPLVGETRVPLRRAKRGARTTNTNGRA